MPPAGASGFAVQLSATVGKPDKAGEWMRKDRLDGAGLFFLMSVTLTLAMNQIIIKGASTGLQPVFMAGARSALAVVLVGLWMQWRGLLPRLRLADLVPGLAVGAIFAVEFLALFVALDITSVGRSSVLFYSMPVWMAILAHFGLEGERLTPLRSLGLLLSFGGMAWAVLSKSPTGQVNLLGDFCAVVAAWGWAGSAFLARKSRLRHAGPEAQLFWMLVVSAPILLMAAPFFGPLLRDVAPVHWALLLLQALIASGGFAAWLWLLSVYPASSVASFSFLTPIFAIGLGHMFFDEALVPGLLGAALTAALGIALINRRN